MALRLNAVTEACEEARNSKPVQLFVISDPGQDLDDEMAVILMRYLQELRLVDVLGIVCNLRPSFDRARLMRGTLDLLGMHAVPVGIGTDGGSSHHKDSFSQSAHTYIPPPSSERSFQLLPARQLMREQYERAEPNSISLLCISSLKDAALFLRDNEALFVAKTKSVTIMGGAGLNESPNSPHANNGPGTPREVLGSLTPDTAHNNMFCKDSAEFLHRKCQELGVPLVIISRFAAYAVPIERATYDDLAQTGGPIGWRLRNMQRATIESLWVRACAAGDAPERQGLPARCDKAWFLTTFCGGAGTERNAAEPIWDLVTSFNMYDSLALLAAIPVLRHRFFMPSLSVRREVVASAPSTSKDYNHVRGVSRVQSLEGDDVVRESIRVAELTQAAKDAEGEAKLEQYFLSGESTSAEHLVFGISKEINGIRNPTELCRFLWTGYRQGLALNHHHKCQTILVAQLRWDNQTDTELALVVLRSLFEFGVLNCCGLLICRAPDGMGSPSGMSLEEQTQTIRDMLATVGLDHIPVAIVDEDWNTSDQATGDGGFGDNFGYTSPRKMDSKLLEMYEMAPETGVVLSVSACLSQVAAFIENHPTLFQQKTRSLVMLGGVLNMGENGIVKPDDGVADANQARPGTATGFLVPDPAAQNNAIDLRAATFVHRRCQELGVPMTVVSRHLASVLQVPRTLYDTVAQVGGRVGARLRDALQNSIEGLWTRVCAVDGSEMRRGLPARCDKAWFAKQFCATSPEDEVLAKSTDDSIWDLVSAFNVYHPLVLLATVDRLRDHYLSDTQEHTVRGVEHLLVGISEERPGIHPEHVTDCVNILCKMILKGCQEDLAQVSGKAVP